MLVTIMDFVLLEKRDDLIHFDNDDSQNNTSIELLANVDRIFRALCLNDSMDQSGKVVPMVSISH